MLYTMPHPAIHYHIYIYSTLYISNCLILTKMHHTCHMTRLSFASYPTCGQSTNVPGTLGSNEVGLFLLVE